MLKPTPNIKGYLRVRLYDGEGFGLYYFIHRLVATVWRENPDPEKKNQVNHRDWDIWNNDADNLDWVTPSENMKWNRRRYRGVRYVHKPDPDCPF